MHLRFGPVARGGLRWSDRPADFRTEVLGLVKRQAVKDAVTGDYSVYEGTVKLTGKLPAGTKADGAIEVRVRLTACKEGTCLLPSTVKVTAK